MNLKPVFNHFDLKLLNPSFDSELVDVLTELEVLRHSKFETDVDPLIFSQIKNIFHMLESLGSARIEGNHTTLSDYVENKTTRHNQNEQIKEIENIENALQYIDNNFLCGDSFSEHFIKELHQLAVDNLKAEGDKTPGSYRKSRVVISGSQHLPPEQIKIPEYMDEFIQFINNSDRPKYDLMKIALAHHRFGWIHPFSNGNGRTVRLITYALLIKYGFNVQASGRVLNPTAVFCNDRETYYKMLSEADTGKLESLEKWCTYVLSGILKELKKLDELSDSVSLNNKILIPALNYMEKRGLIEIGIQKKILEQFILKGRLKLSDLKNVIPNVTSYQINKLIDQKLLKPIKNNSRIYTLRISDSSFTQGIIFALIEANFIKDF